MSPITKKAFYERLGRIEQITAVFPKLLSHISLANGIKICVGCAMGITTFLGLHKCFVVPQFFPICYLSLLA